MVPKFTHTKAQECEFQVDGFDICTNIANGKRGVIIYTAKGLNASPPNKVDCKFEESCWVEIELQGKDKLLVGCIYRSPNSDPANNEGLFSSLRNISAMNEYSHFLICGDFNFPDIDWIADISPGNTKSLGFQFRECLRDCFLFQHVKEYTHRRGDQKPSTIDLVLTNEEGMIEDLSLESPLGKSHHSALVFNLICYAKYRQVNTLKPLYNKGDYSKLRERMSSYEWEKDLEEKTCEESWNTFMARMDESVKAYIPKKNLNYGKPGRHVIKLAGNVGK